MFTFLLSAIAISLSGVMAPGPMSAVTLAAGARHRHAGAMIAIGHALVEIPLILLLVMGVASFLDSNAARAAIGFAGGVVLVLMGLQSLRCLRRQSNAVEVPAQRHPLVIGMVLTAANPYFLVWWGTVGLALATEALALGVVVLMLFTIVHWLCDLGWLEFLSMAGFKGSKIFGQRAQFVVSVVCGLMLLGFGGKFLYDAGIGFATG